MAVLAKHLPKANIVRIRRQFTARNHIKSASVLEKSCPPIVASHNYDVKAGGRGFALSRLRLRNNHVANIRLQLNIYHYTFIFLIQFKG